MAHWPINTNGSSTGFLPIHVRINHEATIIQNINWFQGLNSSPSLFLVFENGRINMIRSAARRATTPPNLFGIDRRIAYNQRKYHSGWIWIGVTKGFAFKKFSGSVNMLGINKIIERNISRAITYPRRSLIE